MNLWSRTGYAPRDEAGQILASMDADDDFDEEAAIGEVLWPIVHAWATVALVAGAAAGVLTLYPVVMGL